jgi:hypothetical protein
MFLLLSGASSSMLKSCKAYRFKFHTHTRKPAHSHIFTAQNTKATIETLAMPIGERAMLRRGSGVSRMSAIPRWRALCYMHVRNPGSRNSSCIAADVKR